MTEKQWDNTPPATMVDSETHIYECRKDGHLHRICCSNKLSEKKRVCQYCKAIMKELNFEKEKTNERSDKAA